MISLLNENYNFGVELTRIFPFSNNLNYKKISNKRLLKVNLNSKNIILKEKGINKKEYKEIIDYNDENMYEISFDNLFENLKKQIKSKIDNLKKNKWNLKFNDSML
jgi:hypothetical protein